MKVVILGGTGFIGSQLGLYLKNKGFEVNTLGRKAFEENFELSSVINRADVLVMLAGENIAKRWTKKYKKAMWHSRIQTTQLVAMALKQCDAPPKKILSVTGVSIYPEGSDEKCWTDNEPFKVPDTFLAQLALEWEKVLNKLHPKPVIFRLGVVLGSQGGALKKLLTPFKFGLGGPVAGGKQLFSWVHIEDVCRAFEFAITHDLTLECYNLSSPNAVSNDQFGRSLARKLQRPYGFPLPKWLLKLIFGEGAQILSNSTHVCPEKLLIAGYEFKFSELDQAMDDLVK